MNRNKFNFLKLVLYFFSFVLAVSFFIIPESAQAASLSGRILLQVEDKGQAWYVNPLDGQRYYLGRPDDAFRIMRTFGLGVSNYDLSNFLLGGAPSRLSGRILLQVEDKGQAYYVEPLSRKLHYLGRPTDAFAVIRSFGLGISNLDLVKITISASSALEPNQITPSLSQEEPSLETKSFSFKYNNLNQTLNLPLLSSTYEAYRQSPKVYTYLVSSPPDNLREAFYSMFLELKAGDQSIDNLISGLNNLAAGQGLAGEQILELALALIQYIPYDQAKAELAKSDPFYPYETLYLNKGVCSDKTFLAYVLLKRLGYGVAILDFPDINHSAIGISCPLEYSLASSGYCYAETTNYFPVGVIPNNINGQAQTGDYGFDTLFAEDKLGTIEILNKVSGNKYNGVVNVRAQAAELSRLYQELTASRDNLDSYTAIKEYNQKVEQFNALLKSFYQQ